MDTGSSFKRWTLYAVISIGMFLGSISAASAAPQAKLELLGINGARPATFELTSDPSNFTVVGEYTDVKTFTSSVGEESGWTYRLSISGGFHPETGALTANLSGTFDTFANYASGEKAKSHETIIGSLTGTPDGRNGWSGTASVSYPVATREGSAAGTQVAGSTETGTFRLTILDKRIPVLNGPADISASVVGIEGDVEYRRGNKGEWKPLTKDVVLGKGDYVVTGVESRVSLNIDGHTLRVTPVTQLRIDEFVKGDNLQKTQIYLNVGTIRATVRHTPAIRSDFRVATPGANASIRGSEMVVQYNETSKETVVFVTEDKAYVQGLADTREQEVAAEQKIIVGEDQKTLTPVVFTDEEVRLFLAEVQGSVGSDSVPPRSNSIVWAIIVGVVVVVGVMIGVFKKKKRI